MAKGSPVRQITAAGYPHPRAEALPASPELSGRLAARSIETYAQGSLSIAGMSPVARHMPFCAHSRER